jgi:hypothetical protein
MRVMTSALAGLYKLAGVDFIREQLTAELAPAGPSFELTDSELIVWNGRRDDGAIAYDLLDRRNRLRPIPLHGHPPNGAPLLDARRVFFSRVPLTWEQWVAIWQQDHEGKGHPQLFSDGLVLGGLAAAPQP